MQQRLDSFLFRRLHALGHDHTEFELHGSEIWRGGRQWSKVDQPDRRRILSGAFGALAGYAPPGRRRRRRQRRSSLSQTPARPSYVLDGRYATNRTAARLPIGTTTGPEAYRRADGIGVIPAALLTA